MGSVNQQRDTAIHKENFPIPHPPKHRNKRVQPKYKMAFLDVKKKK